MYQPHTSRNRRDVLQIRRYVKLNLPEKVIVFRAAQNPRLMITFKNCKVKGGITLCTIGKEETYKHVNCIQGIILNHKEQVEKSCSIELINGPVCQVQKKEIGTVISTYEKVHITQNEIQTRPKLFDTKDKSSCQDVCLIKKTDTS